MPFTSFTSFASFASLALIYCVNHPVSHCDQCDLVFDLAIRVVRLVVVFDVDFLLRVLFSSIFIAFLMSATFKMPVVRPPRAPAVT